VYLKKWLGVGEYRSPYICLLLYSVSEVFSTVKLWFVDSHPIEHCSKTCNYCDGPEFCG
jgi:hypothetical protein